MEEFRSPLVDPPAELLDALEDAEEVQEEARKSFARRRDEWIENVVQSLNGSEEHWTEPKKYESAEVVEGTGKLTLEDDGSWLFSGQNVSQAIYEIALHPEASEDKPIRAFRLDALPHATFGKPRQLARSVNGNFVLTDAEVSVVASNVQSRTVNIARAGATFEQTSYPVAHAIDDDPKSGWAVFGSDVRPQTVSAHFVLAEALALAEGERILVRLAHE